MRSRRGLLILAVPLVGLLLLTAALAVRSSGEAPQPRVAQAPAPPERRPAPPRTAALPRANPAPKDAQARALDESRMRSTYQLYWGAVATGNRTVQKSLHASLARDRDLALRIAEEEVAKAKTPYDRDISQKTLETLRR